jgi:hypothetical protein
VDDEEERERLPYKAEANCVGQAGWFLWREKKGAEWKLTHVKWNDRGLSHDDGTKLVGHYMPAWPPEAKPLTLADVALITKPGEKVQTSPWGYVIAADGTVYALTHQYYHGVVAAILLPEEAAKRGYAAPCHECDCAEEDENGGYYVNVFHYQAFELNNGRNLPLIRISMAGYTGGFNVSSPAKGATPEAVEALRRVALACGRGPRSEIHTEFGDMTVTKALKEIAKGWD